MVDKQPRLVCDVSELTTTTLLECQSHLYQYLRLVYGDSLTDELRDSLRAIARGEVPSTQTADELARLGLITRDGIWAPWRIDNPALHSALTPLRIHHLSDVHVGPKTALEVDPRFRGVVARDITRASAAENVRKSYLSHLRAQTSQGRGPHLAVLTGDLTEYGNDVQYRELKQWLDELLAVVKESEHACLPPKAPRLLIAGGNHDVDRSRAGVGEAPHLRHVPFADFLKGFGDDVAHPHMETPIEERSLTVLELPDAELALVLLGSAELGGQATDDPVLAELIELAEKLPLKGARKKKLDALRGTTLAQEAVAALFDGLTDLSDEEQKVAQKIRDYVSRVDPSLVHIRAIEALRKRKWRQRVLVAALHHPVSHMEAAEVGYFPAMVNANALKDALMQQGFSLVLHGHIHAGRFVAESWPDRYPDRTLRIAAAPSLGSSEIAANNGYNEVTLLRDLDEAGQPTVQVVVRRVQHHPDGSWTSDGPKMGPFAPSV